MLHRDRQVGELGMMIEGDDGQSRGRKHHGVAGLADGLAAGEQQEIATGAPVQLQFRISFRLESGLGIQRIHYCSCPTGLAMPRGAGARAATPDVVQEKRLPLKPKGEYFCCMGPAWRA